MPIVNCPSCGTRYDPGIGDDIEGMPENMSMKVVCPSCGQWLRLPENEPILAPDVSPEILREMSKQSRIVEEGPGAWPSRPAREEREGSDDEPRRSRRPRTDDDYDRPGRRWRDEDSYGDARDDYDDNYSRRSQGDGMGVAAMIVGIISCVFAFGCCVPYLGFVTGPLTLIGAVTAIILGFVGRSRTPGSGKALAGIITGFAALLVMVLLVVVAVVFVGLAGPGGP